MAKKAKQEEAGTGPELAEEKAGETPVENDAQGGQEDLEAGPAALSVAELTPDEKRRMRQMLAQQRTAEGEAAVGELEVLEPTPMMPFNPRDFNKMWALAGHVSNSSVVPEGLRGDAGGVFAVMARGSLLGVHWSVAVQEAYVVNGKLGWSAAVLDSLIETSPAFEYFEVKEATDTYAIVEAKKKRWSEPRDYKVTIEEAQAAGYLDASSGRKYSQVWKTRPKLMLIAMARREAARMWDPSRLAGVYTFEELMVEAELRLAAGRAALPSTAGLHELAQRRLGAGVAPPADPDEPAPPPAAAEPAVPPPATAPANAKPAVAPAGPARLSASLVAQVRRTCEQHPAVEAKTLESVLECSLEDLRGRDGESEQDLYSRVLRVIKPLKEKAGGRGRG